MRYDYESSDEEQQSERRLPKDRRRFTIRTLICAFSNGRRRQIRRNNDQFRGGYVDQHEPRILFATLGILLLSGTDAALTLTLLGHGALELNTFMAVLIETDVQLFTASKMALTGVALIFLVAHARFRLFRLVKVSHVIHVLFSLYSLLIAYELILLALLAS